MLLGYNTNGLAHHDPAQAVELLAKIGYQSVALTLDHGLLNPYSAELKQQVAQMRRLLERHGLATVIETGARYLLDPAQKHEPTLVTADPEGRAKRIDFLKRAVDVARALGSQCVSLWSGTVRDNASEQQAMERLVSGLREVLDFADEHASQPRVAIGFEPEPGMLIDTMDRYAELRERIAAPHFLLTLDIGHLHCQGEAPIADHIRRWSKQLVNVHIEDMRRGVHEHLMFGEGEIDFPPIIAALAEANYQGGVHVELSRHSHVGPQTAREAYGFLEPLVQAQRG